MGGHFQPVFLDIRVSIIEEQNIYLIRIFNCTSGFSGRCDSALICTGISAILGVTSISEIILEHNADVIVVLCFPKVFCNVIQRKRPALGRSSLGHFRGSANNIADYTGQQKKMFFFQFILQHLTYPGPNYLQKRMV